MINENAFATMLRLCINADLRTDEFISASFTFADIDPASGLVECRMAFFDAEARDKFAASLNAFCA
jgi:hypothetical protein